MKKIQITLLLGAAFAALSATASASVMYCTQTGYMSGSLGGVSFTNAVATLRKSGDTSNVIHTTICMFGAPIPVWGVAGVTTINIAGFETAVVAILNKCNTLIQIGSNLC